MTRLRAASAGVGAVSVPAATGLLLMANSFLPWSMSWVVNAVLFFGSPVTWLLVAQGTHRTPFLGAQVAFYCLLGAAVGAVLWKRLVLAPRCICMHAARLAVVSWAGVCGFAAVALAVLFASGVH